MLESIEIDLSFLDKQKEFDSLGYELIGSKEVNGKMSVGLVEIVNMFDSAERVIRERGKAELGNKTMLDAVAPAVETLKCALEEGKDIIQAFESASNAACEGAKATISMKARSGRSRWLGDRTIGIQDPGASAVCFMLEICAEYLSIQKS